MRPVAVVRIAVAAALCASPAAVAQEASELREIRLGASSASTTRIVFDLAGAPRFDLSGDGEGAGRIFVDFANLASVRPAAREAAGRGLVAGASYRPNSSSVARVVLPLRRSVRIEDVFVIPPSDANPLHRLVIDVSADTRAAFVASLRTFSGSGGESDRVSVDARPAAVASSAPAAAQAAAPEAARPAEARSALDIRSPGKAAHTPPPPTSSRVAAASAESPSGDDAPDNPPSRKPSPGGDPIAEAVRASEIIPPLAEPPVRAEASPPVPSAASPMVVARAVDLPVVVIDPGHGGADPGAIGAGGALEKNVTLAAAEALKAELEKSGRYKVVLTRTGDERLALEERTPIARKAGADLFISLHADALKDRSVRGASVYTLSDEGTRRSMLVAQEEGDLVVFDVDLGGTDPEVRDILFDLAHEQTGSRSDRLAEILVGKLGHATPLLNNTHRRGDLRVLLAPDVPAVLLELGFLSNAEDEANFISEAWRKKAMTAVAAAIDAYFQSAPSERHAAASETAARRP